MSTWITIVAIAAGTYAMRASMFVAFSGRELPTWTDRPMKLVAPAAVAALVSSMLMVDAGSVELPPIPELVAVVVGFAAVRRSGSVMHAFVAGLPTLWLLGAFLG